MLISWNMFYYSTTSCCFFLIYIFCLLCHKDVTVSVDLVAAGTVFSLCAPRYRPVPIGCCPAGSDVTNCHLALNQAVFFSSGCALSRRRVFWCCYRPLGHFLHKERHFGTLRTNWCLLLFITNLLITRKVSNNKFDGKFIEKWKLVLSSHEGRKVKMV